MLLIYFDNTHLQRNQVELFLDIFNTASTERNIRNIFLITPRYTMHKENLNNKQIINKIKQKQKNLFKFLYIFLYNKNYL